MRKALAMTLFLLVMTVSVFAVGQARMTGKVVDPAGNPIPNATIELTAIKGKTFNETYKAKKDGTFAIAVVDGTLTYRFTISAEGFAPYQEEIKMKLAPEKNERTFTLGAPGGATMTAAFSEAKADPAVVAYNEGAALHNAGDTAGAMAKFQEAVRLKPDLAAAHMALAKGYMKANNHKEAIASAEKALEIAIDDDEMFAILADAYEKTGNKAKAAEFKKKAPANPPALFNEAAKHINAGRDSEAEPLLRQAVTADEKFAKAHYELGMIYVRMGDTGKAKTSLQKYLSLEPNGKDAPTAKEMLQYLN